MIEQLCRLLLLISLGCFSTLGWCAEINPGGKGKIESGWSNSCFRPKSDTVLEVCSKYIINWKMWSLMGEPVGDYNLTWQLVGITLKDPQGRGDSNVVFQTAQLPNELRKAAKAIELYVDGYTSVNASGMSHRFNTGVPVRAGAGSSYNTPASPNWDRLFVSGGNVCDDKTKIYYQDVKEAKNMFSHGIQLNSPNFTLCPTSGVSELSAIEGAISKLCEKPNSDLNYRFCSKRKEKLERRNAAETDKVVSGDKGINNKPHASSISSEANPLDGAVNGSEKGAEVGSLLDESAERPQIEKRLAQERAIYRHKSEPACNAAMKNINACYAKSGCLRAAERPAVDQCNAIPAYPASGYSAPVIVLTQRPSPGEVCYYEDAECRAVRAENKRIEERKKAEAAEIRGRKQAEWTSRYGTLSEECKLRAQERDVFDSCQRQHNATCNPKKFNSVSDCLDDKVRSQGPTLKDAQELMHKEWGKRSKTGSSITKSILD